ncbi:MAG: polyprenyl diphosphate synthase [Candidatus Levyibacteriota bacterium]
MTERVSRCRRFEHFPRLEGLSNELFPSHLAIIPDGNRRWAKTHKLSALKGHDNGRRKVSELTRHLKELPINILTFWAFSSDNWHRDPREVEGLMKIINAGLMENRDELINDNSRFIHVGRKDRIPEDLRQTLEDLEEDSRANSGRIIVMAIDFGGVDQSVRMLQDYMETAVREFSEQQDSDLNGESSLPLKADIFVAKKRNELTTENIKELYDGQGLISPADLLIRTSGELRTSDVGWLNGKNTELYFTDTHFPEITDRNIEDGILDFSRRKRRMGK